LTHTVYLWTKKSHQILNVVRNWIRIKNVLKDSSTIQDRAFIHNLAQISGKTSHIFMKISVGHNSVLNVGSHPNQSCLVVGLISVCFYFYLYLSFYIIRIFAAQRRRIKLIITVSGIILPGYLY